MSNPEYIEESEEGVCAVCYTVSVDEYTGRCTECGYIDPYGHDWDHYEELKDYKLEKRLPDPF